MNTPSSILTRAADLIRDTAAAAADGPWAVVESDLHTSHDVLDDEDGFFVDSTSETVALGAYVASASGAKIGSGCSYCMQGTIGVGNARWIALLSPAVAPTLELILRNAAKDYTTWSKIFTPEAMAKKLTERRFAGPLALACAVLGVQEVSDAS